MTRVSVEEAVAQLPQLIEEAGNGEEVIITKNSEPFVKLVPVQSETDGKRKPRARFGSGKGLILYMADDFDAPLEDFNKSCEAVVPAR